MSREAQEMEMVRERYVNDLHLILTGEGQEEQSFSFHLAPKQCGSPVLQLSYEKVQNNMSVSGMQWFADFMLLALSFGIGFILLSRCDCFLFYSFCLFFSCTVWCTAIVCAMYLISYTSNLLYILQYITSPHYCVWILMMENYIQNMFYKNF